MPSSNNKTVKSLTINKCEFVLDGHQVPTPTPAADRKSLTIHCPTEGRLEKILHCIHVPQFKGLDTTQLSCPWYYLDAVATDSSGPAFQFFQSARPEL